MMKCLLSTKALILFSVFSLHAAYDPNVLVRQFETKYEYLEAFNDQNEREGHPELNQYIIELNPNWAEERPGIRLLRAEYASLTNILRGFNNSRKDSLRFYVVVTGVLEYPMEKNVKLEQLPKSFSDKDFSIQFNNILSGKNKFEIYDFLFGQGVGNIRNEILEAMIAKGYTERVLYCYTGVRLYDQGSKEKWYSVDNLSLTGALAPKQDKIRAKARNLWTYSDLPYLTQAAGERIKLAVANIITAIGVEYDGGGASTSGLVNCGKDPDDIATETFKRSVEYDNAVKSMAQLLDGPRREQYVSSNYIIADKPENFINRRLRDLVLPDVVFNTEILPDKLNLMKGRSDYELYVVFKEVPFVIPDNKRVDFANSVKEQSVVAKRANTVVIVVPYYSCADNEIYVGADDRSVTGLSLDVEYVYPMLLMPAACSTNTDMNTLMNAALIGEKSFRDGFNQAFKQVPKDHMAYLGYLVWNGQQIYEELPQKRVTGFSNFADVQLLVDERFEKIMPYLNCNEKHESDLQLAMMNSQFIPFDVTSNPPYENYLKCLRENRDAIERIVSQHPNPGFKELNAGLCTIRQRILTGDDGMLTAMGFIQASFHGMRVKFWVNNKGETILKSFRMDDDIFYGNKNPYPTRPWILSVIDAGSFLASFVGLDFIFDAAGGIVCVAIDDGNGAAVYAASILVPAAIFKSWKYVKEMRNIGSLSEQAYKLSLKSGVVVHTAAGPLVAQLGGTVNMVPGTNSGADLLRTLGVADEEVLAIAKSDPSIAKALEESMTTRHGYVVVSRPEQQIQYSADEIRIKANDRDLVKRYQEARDADPSLDFVSFLRQVEPKVIFQVDPMLADVAKYIKYDPRYFYVFIHGTDYDGFALALGDGTNVFISHLQVADWLVLHKNFVDAITKEGKSIKLISCSSAANRSAEQLSARLHELSKMDGSPIKGASPVIEAPDVDYGVNIRYSDAGAVELIEEGSMLPKGKWYAYKDGKALGPIKENPDIPQFTRYAGSRVSGNAQIYGNLLFDISKFLDHADVVSFKKEVIQKKIHEQFPNHTIDELTAIRYYTEKSEINRQLGQNTLDEFHQGLHYLLKSGLDKGVPYTKEVYSGLGDTRSLIADSWKVSDEVTFDTYTSCALYQIIGERFMNSFHGHVLLVIKDPQAMDISKISRYAVEEVLVQPGVKFKITSIETDGYMGRTWKVITLVRSPAGQ